MKEKKNMIEKNEKGKNSEAKKPIFIKNTKTYLFYFFSKANFIFLDND
jgi:hypothetical protein